jgi:dUTP pyrophosphatase
MSDTVKIKKLRENAALPVRATATAAGYDICFAPVKSILKVTVFPGRIYKCETGLAFELPENMAMLVLPRSGMVIKQQLRPANTPGLIDSDYRGELFVALENFGSCQRDIRPGDRIAQVVFINALHPMFETVEELSTTDRGEGGFGSTGVNNNE